MAQAMITPVVKRTKAEILDAYEALRRQYEEEKKAQPPLPMRQAQKQEEERILQQTADQTPATVEQATVAFKGRLMQTLDALQRDLLSETSRLAAVREATAIEERRLKETRQISLADDALQTLIAQFDQKKQELEGETLRQRRAWEQEEEEYVYNRKMKRREEEDAYRLEQEKKRLAWVAEMKAKEEELTRRKKELDEQDNELAALREQVDRFPVERDEAVKQAVTQRVNELNREFEHEKRLLIQEATAARQVLEAKVESLGQTVERQSAEIQSLKQALTEASKQTQLLASTVVENVSGAKHLQAALQSVAEKQGPQPFPRPRQ